MPLYLLLCWEVCSFCFSSSLFFFSSSYSVFSWKCSFFLNWEDLCLEKKKKDGSLGKVSRVSCYPKNNHAQNKHKRTQRKEGLFFTNRKDKASSFALQRWGNRMHMPCGFILVNSWHGRMLTLTRQLWKTKVNKPSKGIRGWTQPKSRQWSYACQTAILLFVLKIYLATLRILNAMEERIMSMWFFQSTVWKSNQTERVSNNSKR